MPVQSCTRNGKKGHKWGVSGTCYIGPRSRELASRQGRAILANQKNNDVGTRVKVQLAVKKQTLNKNFKPNPFVARPPIPIEVRYNNILQRYISEIVPLVRDTIKVNLPGIEAERDADFNRDAWPQTVDTLILTLKNKIQNLGPVSPTSIEFIADETNDWNDQQWQKQMKAVVGVNITTSESWLPATLTSFVDQNVALITKMTDEWVQSIQGTMQRGFNAGLRHEEIAKEIQSRTGITRRRAELIARDQVSKLNADLTKNRQQDVGVESYFWRTAGDERVRASHRANNNKKFDWDNPPAQTGHPGHDVRCRCIADPDFTPVFEELGIKPEEQPLQPENTPPAPSRPAPKEKVVSSKKGENPTASEFRRDILKEEDKIRFNNFETALIYGDNRKLQTSIKGNKDSVTIPFETRKFLNSQKNAVLTHNHPGDGGSFSTADLRLTNAYNLKEMRATSKDYLYVLGRPKTKDGWNGVSSERVRKLSAKATRDWKKDQRAINSHFNEQTRKDGFPPSKERIEKRKQDVWNALHVRNAQFAEAFNAPYTRIPLKTTTGKK